MYVVEWSAVAREDLFTKVSSNAVAAELVRVGTDALDLPPSKDGGPIGRGGWRRGISRQRQREIDAAERAGTDLDSPGEHAWDYVLVYEVLDGLVPRYRVRAVLTNSELAAGITEWPSLDTVPVFD